MAKQPTLAGRRKAAVEMAPGIAEMFELMAERDAALDVDSEHATLRREKATRLMLRDFADACSWSPSEVVESLSLEVEEDTADAA
jgi:hypothetical protein